jgi:hypothetical protein
MVLSSHVEITCGISKENTVVLYVEITFASAEKEEKNTLSCEEKGKGGRNHNSNP